MFYGWVCAKIRKEGVGIRLNCKIIDLNSYLLKSELDAIVLLAFWSCYPQSDPIEIYHKSKILSGA